MRLNTASPNNQGFRRDPDSLPVADLNRFLRSYGLKGSLNDLVDEEDGKLPVYDVMQELPEKIEEGVNAAREALRKYYEAFPPSERADGIRLTPQSMLELLLNQTEYYHEIADGLVRMCNGDDCEHYSVCPFKDQVKDNEKEDGIECMVDRKVVQGAIESFVDPPEGRPKVDPRRPAQALLFEQLVQQLVKQRRISMHMQKSSVLVDHWEILQDGEVDKFKAMNKSEHALVETWDRTHKRIEKLLKAMGITPRFEIQQDRFEHEEERLDAEDRANELFLDKLEDALHSLPESDNVDTSEIMSPEDAIQKALKSVQQKEEQHKQTNDEDDR